MKEMKWDLLNEYLSSMAGNRARFVWEGISIGGGVFCLVVAITGFSMFYNGSFGKISKANLESVKLSARPTVRSFRGFMAGRTWYLESDDAEEIKKAFRSTVTEAGPVYCFPEDKRILTGEGIRDYASVTATHPAIFPLLSVSMRYGRFINELDMQKRRKVCILGQSLMRKWFGDEMNPCGIRILVGGISYQIVGVLEKDNKMVTPFGNEEDCILIPYPTADAVYHLEGRLTHLAFSLMASEGFEKIREEVVRHIRNRHGIDPQDTDATLAESYQDYSQMLAVLFKGIGILFGVVFIGLVMTGLLGIFSITLLSVHDRADEIGIRLALGTDSRQIRIQFACESLAVVLVSSLTGLLFSEACFAVLRWLYSGGFFPASLLGMPQLSFWGILTVLALLWIGGFYAGYLPSRSMAEKTVSELLND